MNKIIFTDVNISKGFNDAPAFRFNDKKTAVQFKIGQRVYDKDAPDKHRYLNFAVKAFTPLSERIDKMLLKAGSRINVYGRLDEEQWEEKGQKLSRYVIIAEDIEYASSDTGKSNGNGSNSNGVGSAPPVQNGQDSTPQNAPVSPPVQNQQNSSEEQPGTPANFTGFDNFDTGGDNVFF